MALFILFSLLSSSTLFSQESSSAVGETVDLSKLLKFRNYNTDDGLPDNYIVDIHQDSYGLLWIATENGLSVFDGYSFKTYTYSQHDSTSISSNQISFILEDPADEGKAMWIATKDGLNLFDRESDTFTRLMHDPADSLSLPSSDIVSIMKSRDGTMWLGFYGDGLAQMTIDDEATGDLEKRVRYKRYLHSEDSTTLSNNYLRMLFEDSAGRIWASTSYGLSILDKERKAFKRYYREKNNESSISSLSVFKVVEDSSGVLWVATLGGRGLQRAIVADNGDVSFIRHGAFSGHPDSLQSTTVLDLHVDKMNNLWIATLGGGLGKYDGKRFTHWKQDEGGPRAFEANSIFCLTEDQSGILWIGSVYNGIFSTAQMYPQNVRFHHLSEEHRILPEHRIHSIIEDHTGKIWLGTESGIFTYTLQDGLLNLVRETVELEIIGRRDMNLDRMIVTSLLYSGKDELWIASEFLGGLFKMNVNSGVANFFYNDRDDPSSIHSNTITGFYKDKNDAMWITTVSGIARYTGSGFINYMHDETAENTLASNDVWGMVHDHDSLYWVGTDNGLSKLIVGPNDEAYFTNFYHQPEDNNTLSHNAVRAIHKDLSGNIWIGTSGGLNQLIKHGPDSVSFKSYLNDGERAVEIRSIQEDDNDHLWLNTSIGLSRFDPSTGNIKTFDTGDGLQSKVFNRYANLRHSSGLMLFGGQNGLNIFDPKNIKESQFIAPIQLTSLKVLNKPVSPGKRSVIKKHISLAEEIRLGYQENYLTIEYASLDYRMPSKNQYAYKLEGLQADWVYVGSRNYADYTNLDPGEYVFRVKATNSDGIWNEEGTSVKIIITPPPWKTWWAYSLYFIFALAAFWAFRSYELNRQRLKHELEMEQIEAGRLQELDKLKSRFFANISHEFRTPLALILGPLQQLSDGTFNGKPKELYPVMIQHAQKLLRLINQFLDLSTLEAGKMSLRAAPQNIVSFAETLLSLFKSQAEEKSISLNFESVKDEIEIYFDSDKLEKVLVNLISNALKFTSDGGTLNMLIEIDSASTNEEGSHVIITLKDTGIGISEADAPHVFDRFYQVDDSQTRVQQGTGIGLALSKELIELHKGSLSLKSKVGAGSTFYIRLPLGKAHLKPDDIVEAEPVTFSSLPNEIHLHSHTEEAGESQESEEHTEKPILLIIEDHPSFRNYLRLELQSNYHVLESENGEDGLSAALEAIPDLIISDVMMPKMDGFELCEQLKTNELTSHIPVILLTARASGESRLEGLEIGADDYLTKPFESRELHVRIKNLIEQRQKLREKFSKAATVSLKDIAVTSLDEKFLNRAIEVVETHISNADFDVETFSREVGLSRTRLHRKLKALTDQSTTEFIRSLRLRRAAQLLADQSGNVTDVAYDVGFNNLSYFTRSFKKLYGESPSAYAARFSDKKSS